MQCFRLCLHIINHFFCLPENNKIIAGTVELVVQIYSVRGTTFHIFVSHLTIVFVIILIPGPLAVNKFSPGKFRNVVILKDHFEQLIFFSPVVEVSPHVLFPER